MITTRLSVVLKSLVVLGLAGLMVAAVAVSLHLGIGGGV